MSDAPALAGYHHLGLTVSDVDRSEAWYADTFGLVRAFVEQHDNTSGYAVVMTRPGTTFFIGLDHHEDADRQPFAAQRTGLDHLALAVTSAAEVEEWAAHFDRLGVAHDPVLITEDPMPLALVQVRDPDGIPIEVIWTGA